MADIKQKMAEFIGLKSGIINDVNMPDVNGDKTKRCFHGNARSD